MRQIGKTVAVILLIALLVLTALYFNDDIGVIKSKLESDARSSQKIPEDWLVQQAVSDTMAALIFYPEDHSDYTYSFYVNRPGLSFGYFFRSGGSLPGSDPCISEFTLAGSNESAFLSMNEQAVGRVEIDDGRSVQVIDIDRGKPFAVILPLDEGRITFYDGNGNRVDTAKSTY